MNSSRLASIRSASCCVWFMFVSSSLSSFSSIRTINNWHANCKAVLVEKNEEILYTLRIAMLQPKKIFTNICSIAIIKSEHLFERNLGMDLMDKLKILVDAAKYDVACTSSGVDRDGQPRGALGSAVACGICHTFSADGRCVSLLEGADDQLLRLRLPVLRQPALATIRPAPPFTPRELAELTIGILPPQLHRGAVFSALVSSKHARTSTCERMIQTLRAAARRNTASDGYIHAKAIPGADAGAHHAAGAAGGPDERQHRIALPARQLSAAGAGQEPRQAILGAHGADRDGVIGQSARTLVRYRRAPRFAPGGPVAPR